MDFTSPISGIVTSPYGSRDGGFHSGVDIDGGDIGAPVYAARSGVAGTYYGESYGNFVVIDHGSGYITEYGHLNDFTISDGEQVEHGQQIGEMGSTGNSTGPHLHLTTELNNETQPIPASDGDGILELKPKTSAWTLLSKLSDRERPATAGNNRGWFQSGLDTKATTIDTNR